MIKKQIISCYNNTKKKLSYTKTKNMLTTIYYNHVYNYKNYEEYKKIQINTNQQKITCVGVHEETIKTISNYLKENISDIRFGICHGTRRGKEQMLFRKYLEIDVIGTEISPNATEFLYTIEWDFHDVKDEWVHNVDFIYSNALDHSYKPVECLDAWMTCLNDGGVCILDWSNAHKYSSKTDPFGGSFAYYTKMIECKYCIKDIIKIYDTVEHIIFIISKKNIGD